MGRRATLVLTGLFLVLVSFFVEAQEVTNIATGLRVYKDTIEYEVYLHQHLEAGVFEPEHEVVVRGRDYDRASGEVTAASIEGVDCVYTGEDAVVEWEVDIPSAGLYNIELEYYPVEGRGTSIERALEINGEVPFEGAEYLRFSRIWGDAEDIVTDNQGSELRPLQKEHPSWTRHVLNDSMGDYLEPYKFYLSEGRNTLALRSRREPVAIKSVRIFQLPEPPSYKEVLAMQLAQGHRPASGVMIRLQERDSTYRSSSTLSPQPDRGDPTLEPYHPVLLRLNSIGGTEWSQAGEWIRWDFEVPEDGFYKIAIRPNRTSSALL